MIAGNRSRSASAAALKASALFSLTALSGFSLCTGAAAQTVEQTAPRRTLEPAAPLEVKRTAEPEVVEDKTVVVGRTEPQKGAERAVATDLPAMSAEKAIAPPRGPVAGGMAPVEAVRPARIPLTGKPDLQPAKVAISTGEGDQKRDIAGPRGSHVIFVIEIGADGAKVSEALEVPGPAASSKYLKGTIVWRASASGRVIAVGSARDPREQHSLIPPEEQGEKYIAPEPADRGSVRLSIPEKYLSREAVGRLKIEVFEISRSIPTDSEVNLESVRKILDGAKLIGAVSGQELYRALYEDDSKQEPADDQKRGDPQ